MIFWLVLPADGVQAANSAKPQMQLKHEDCTFLRNVYIIICYENLLWKQERLRENRERWFKENCLK